MISLINDIALYFNYSFTFSITIFSFIFWIRTKDKYINLSQWIIFSAFTFQTLIMSQKYFTLLSRAVPDFFYNRGQLITFWAFIGALLSLILISLIMFACSRYFIYHLDLNKKKTKIAYAIHFFINLIFLLISTIVIGVVLPVESWMNMTHIVGYNIFPFACLFIGSISMAAWFLRKKSEDKEKRHILLNISRSFALFLPFSLIDLTLLWRTEIRISFYALVPFFLHLFFHLSRYYYRNYESIPAQKDLSAKMEELDFSAREKEVAGLLILGDNYGEIAEALFISVNTVKTHAKSIYKKARVSNKLQLSQILNKRDY